MAVFKGFVISLHSLKYFLTVNPHVVRRGKSEPNPITLNRNYHDFNIVTDTDLLTLLPAKNQHLNTFLMRSNRSSRSRHVPR